VGVAGSASSRVVLFVCCFECEFQGYLLVISCIQLSANGARGVVGNAGNVEVYCWC